MKKILFVCYGLGIGGIEKCLVNLLNAMDKTEYQIDLLPLNPEYDMLPQLKDGINLLDTFDYAMNTTDTVTALKNKKAGFGTYVKYALFRMENKFGKRPWMFFKSPPKHYDVAVAYSQNGFAPYYVADKVSADKKIMWYHDLRYNAQDRKKKVDINTFSKFDNIVAVSNPCADMLKSNFPLSQDKIIVLHNIIDEEDIVKKSKEPSEDLDSKSINLLTVARISQEKGYENAVSAAEYLRDNNIEFKWYWVGDGPEKEKYQQLIEQKNLDNYFVLTGNKSNPYPFFNKCNIYVQPSFSEAFCTTIMEAKVLCKPIVCTNVKSIYEQVTDGKTALISKTNGMDLGKKIHQIIASADIREKFIHNLKEEKSDNCSLIKKYYNLFG